MDIQFKSKILKGSIFLGIALSTSQIIAEDVTTSQAYTQKTSQIHHKGMELYKYWLTGFYTGYQQGFEEASERSSDVSDQVANFTLHTLNAYELKYQDQILHDDSQGQFLSYFSYSTGYGGDLKIDLQWDCAQNKLRIVSLSLEAQPYSYFEPAGDSVKLVWGSSAWADLDHDENTIKEAGSNYKQVITFNSLTNVELPKVFFNHNLELDISSVQLVLDSSKDLYPEAGENLPSLLYKTLKVTGLSLTTFKVDTDNLKFSGDSFDVIMRTPMSLEACEAVESNS